MYKPKTLHEENVHNKFVMGVKFETSWGLAQKFFNNTLLERVFKKMVSNLSILRLKFGKFLITMGVGGR